MNANKVVLNNEVLVDLTQDTVTEGDVKQGLTFHKADGSQAVGTSTAIVPSGTLVIRENDTYDVTDKASVEVNVAGSGGGDADTVKGLIDGTFAGELNSSATQIKLYMFYEMTGLTSVNFPNATSAGAQAFYKCSNLTTANIPNLAGALVAKVFYSCEKLTSVDLPLVTEVGDQAFYFCSSLTSANLPNVTKLGSSSLEQCRSLTSVDFPLVTSVGSYTLRNCLALTTANLPKLTAVGSYMFAYCSNLTSVNVPLATNVYSYAFQRCVTLKSIDLPLVTSVGNYAFDYCNNLTAVILRSATMCTLSNTNAFRSCNTYIYVPSALIDSYKTATNWSTYATRFRAIEDYPEICGGAE